MIALSLSDCLCWWVQVQTEVMGDIHHYAWRARFRNQTVYIDKRDGERFGDWTSQQCAVSTCCPCRLICMMHGWHTH